MSDEINRHKSTRWVQNATASYGDEWGNEDDYDEEFAAEDVDTATTDTLENSLNDEERNVTRNATPNVTESLQKLSLAEASNSSGTDVGGASNKRVSRFFVTNPDLSDTESDAEVSTSLNDDKDVSLKPHNTTDVLDHLGNKPLNNDDEASDMTEDDEVSSDNLSDEIEPTAPLKVQSRASSRNASVNLDENNMDKLASSKKEKLKSKDYSNIDLVMDDYLSKRDSQFYEEVGDGSQEKIHDMGKLSEEEDEEGADNSENNEHHYQYTDNNSFQDDQSEKLDHDHSLVPPTETEELPTNNLSVTPNDYSLARSISSGSLSTGSWSARSSALFVNGASSARDSFIGKLKTERGEGNSFSNNSERKENVEDNDGDDDDSLADEEEEQGKNSPYLDSSSDDDDDSILFTQGQSINFGHWRPNTSNFRNAFMKETNFSDSESVLPSINNEKDEYDDDSYSVMTTESNLQYPNEEGHFFTKSLNDDKSILQGEEIDDTRSLKTSDDLVSNLEISPPAGFEEQFKSSAERAGYTSDVGDDDDDDDDDDDADSNATETEQVDEEDEGTDIDEDNSASFNDNSLSTDGNESNQTDTPVKQRYSSLLSGSIDTPRQTSMSSSIEPKTRVPSDVAPFKISREVSASSTASSQQATTSVKKSTSKTLKEFKPFDFKQIQKLTNPENKITELRKWSKEESEVDTGLQEWLSTELTKVSAAQDGYDSLGPITLNAYKQATPTTHLHGHSVADMISRKHSINFGGVVGHGRLKLKNKVGDHGGSLAKGIFNRGKKIMRNSSNGNSTAE